MIDVLKNTRGDRWSVEERSSLSPEIRSFSWEGNATSFDKTNPSRSIFKAQNCVHTDVNARTQVRLYPRFNRDTYTCFISLQNSSRDRNPLSLMLSQGGTRHPGEYRWTSTFAIPLFRLFGPPPARIIFRNYLKAIAFDADATFSNLRTNQRG